MHNHEPEPNMIKTETSNFNLYCAETYSMDVTPLGQTEHFYQVVIAHTQKCRGINYGLDLEQRNLVWT